jgi:hypothetical protein
MSENLCVVKKTLAWDDKHNRQKTRLATMAPPTPWEIAKPVLMEDMYNPERSSRQWDLGTFT